MDVLNAISKDFPLDTANIMHACTSLGGFHRELPEPRQVEVFTVQKGNLRKMDGVQRGRAQEC